MRIGIVDLLGKEPPRNGYSRLMRANNTSIMPQVVGVWCEEEGHEVHIAYYSGPELLAGGLPEKLDLVFINAFSQAALLAYAFSAMYRHAGVPTVLGGPHARSYPEDARQYFDYVVGFCDRDLVREILADAGPHAPEGLYLSAKQQPASLPGLRQRWQFLKPSMDRARVLKLVPLLGSLGCPYKCSFCIDAVVPYQPLEYEGLKDDLRFFQELDLPRSVAVWHDPNFGIRFDEYLDAIEEVVPPGRITFVAETSLSLLKEDNLKRLKRNGFKAIAPGIESWFDIGDKSRMKRTMGMEKVRAVAEQANLVNSYIPYTQCNLIFGLDADDGAEPFELTKRFIDLAPGVYPHFALLSAFGRNAVLNLDYQRDGRVLPVPFHFLDLVQAMNVRPKNYTWTEFYDHVIDVFDYSFSARALARRYWTNKRSYIAWEQLFRGLSSERSNRLGYHRKMRRWLEQPEVRGFFEGETRDVPAVLTDQVREHLGPLWKWLPKKALAHDPNAFLHSGSAHPLPVLV
ncbi:B12-binding domain-containing radical SAM protein [Longimicrobium sp.]|uniref:B12-binding domain-containing radical SAM protein n=1 Tax=Longimicrobium sp. TaxID=2029185 RepID=UPI002C189CF8|nr:radical SAM protein [Longimicrobium sp.]HSU18057.1 radical SAM protein [Longimicrobium sp.]